MTASVVETQDVSLVFGHDPAESAEAPPAWVERNQAWLVAALDDLCRQLEARETDGSAAPRAPVIADGQDGFSPALDGCARLFGLSAFEREILLLVTGLELHRGARETVAALNGGSPHVSFGWAFAVLADPHWDAMSPDAPLRAWELVHVESGAPLSSASIRVDERIMHFLTGVAATDTRLRGLVDQADAVRAELDERDAELVERIVEARATRGVSPPVIILRSDPLDVASEHAVALSALARQSLPVLRLSAQDLPSEPREVATIARLVDREATLSGAVPVLSVHDAVNERSAVAFVTRLRSLLIVIGAGGTGLPLGQSGKRVVRLDLPKDDLGSSAGLLRRWRRQSVDGVAEDASVVDALRHVTAQFQPPFEALDEIVTRVRATAPGGRRAEAWAAARAASRGGLDALAQRIQSTARFDDLVVPAAQLAALRDIARQLRQRERVYREWGFGERHARGQGLTALFAGESGTGKTLAAEAIANEVELDLYRVDLATVVSKYIGETEKNLKRVFDAAESSGAVLLFDEADAIFGKRSEVKDSHDRYANIEVAYLLQRVESYRGLAILTTNMKSALDRAFLRRLRFVVHFPFPDPAAREQIWRREFPTAAPVGDIDFSALAKLNVAGGSIHSIVLNGAFKAADGGGLIDQEILMAAARAELAKLERPFGHATGRA